MTQQEHLSRIRAKCERLIEVWSDEPVGRSEHAMAGWRSTIAAIDGLNHLEAALPLDAGPGCRTILNTILAAWPEDCL